MSDTKETHNAHETQGPHETHGAQQAQRDAKRVLAFLLGALYPGLAFDVWLSHFVSGSGEHATQWVPVGFGLLASILLMAVAFKGAKPGPDLVFRRTLQILGAASVLVGLAGLFLHGLPLAEALADNPFTWDAFVEALSLHAPPVLAPGAYALLGLVALGLASPRLVIARLW